MTTWKRMLLFAGGNLGEWAIDHIREDDFLIGVDRGALFLVRHKRNPHLAIGDFDSVTPEELVEITEQSAQFLTCDPVMKDFTDTEMAFNWALERQPEEIVLLGVLGTRFDHTLANVHLLVKGLRAGVDCRILDEKNEVILIDRETSVSRGRFTHISLLPLSEKVTGITLEGFQYPLHNAALRIGDSLGISNVLQDVQGTIRVAAGKLLVIKSMD
ncbi:thiamine diphosphokinase [Brevibacillus sp. H7]|jgi:thiamine pyrophosphokinase|uniref:thiamine diphosphokinase n=1 Tax=Brevibacillus sp. H7 TaxID=3349138 RepID=UPI003820FCE9